MTNVDLHTALTIARSDRESALVEYQAINDRIVAIDEEIKGLELALARHNGKPVAEGPTQAEMRKWRKMSRTDAIDRVLSESEEPMGPREITDVLHAAGRDDERNSVAAAIQYLRRERRVHSLGRGQWVHGVLDDGGAP